MHSPSTPTPLATTDRDRLRHSLQQGRRLRLHGALIAGLTLMGLLASGALLRALGVEALSLRYALSLPLTYLLYLGLLRLWCGWLTRRSRSDAWSGDGLDLLVQGLPGKRESGGVLMRSGGGGGGDFAGAGASGDFGATAHLCTELGSQVATEASPSLTVATVRGSVHAGAIASEGLAAGPLLALLGLVLVLVILLGLSVTTLFGVETLLAVSVEVGLAALAGSLAQQRGTSTHSGTNRWLRLAWRSTWRAALALLLVGILLGAALDRWLPQADSLPQALQLLSHRR